MPITYVMELPVRELYMWADVFKYENDIEKTENDIEKTPDTEENEEEIEVNPEDVFKLIGGEIRR